MTLADLKPTSARIEYADPKIVTLDIERMKGSFTSEFWDLNDMRHRRIHPDDVTEWPRTICVAWKWYDARRVQFASEWGDGPAAMHQKVWDVYDKADIVVGHNIASFDTKKLSTTWLEMGLPKPTPFKTVDTLKIARSELGTESRTLDALCKRFGLVAKTDRYDVEVARAACTGNKAAQRRIKGYNSGDVVANEGLYDYLRGWIPNHPHIGELDESTTRCNQCGGTDLERKGTYLAVQIRYVAYRCRNCGANLRGVAHSRAANIRGVR